MNDSTDPLAPATPVDNPEIDEVLNLQTGQISNVKAFISQHRYDDFISVRMSVRENFQKGNYLYACALCGTPVYVVASPDKKFFFRHAHEDGSCTAHTRGRLSLEEIRARKYNGQRESEAHKRIKALIERSLLADSNFQSVAQERSWRAARDPKSRRQPDVQAESNRFGRIAFEVQLSNTFLDEVASRRNFYRENGGLLIWVLGRFLPEYRRLMVDDLLFSNNSNIFVVDDETTKLSEECRMFHMRCFFRRPFRDGTAIIDNWSEEIVSFAQLTCDIKTQTAFFFDYDGEEKRLHDVIATDAEVERERADQALRDEFLSLLTATEEDYDIQARWDTLAAKLESRGIPIPYHSQDSGFRALMFSILSAKEGEPVGWKFQKLIQVANQIFHAHKEHLLAFGYAIKHYGRTSTLDTQDKKGIWTRRRAIIREALHGHDPDFLPNQLWLPALLFLFPDIGRHVKAYIDRLDKRLDDF